jgi:hypothetical protein
MSPVEQAKELMSLVATPSALVGGTFLAFAGRAIKENRLKVDHARMWFAMAASIAALGVTVALFVLMAPLTLRSGWIDGGSISSVLVVYSMITASVGGTAIFSVWTLIRCIKELRRPSH